MIKVDHFVYNIFICFQPCMLAEERGVMHRFGSHIKVVFRSWVYDGGGGIRAVIFYGVNVTCFITV